MDNYHHLHYLQVHDEVERGLEDISWGRYIMSALMTYLYIIKLLLITNYVQATTGNYKTVVLS